MELALSGLPSADWLDIGLIESVAPFDCDFYHTITNMITKYYQLSSCDITLTAMMIVVLYADSYPS